MNRKKRRIKTISFEEWRRRKKKRQEVKEWAQEIALLLGGFGLFYVIIWLLCAIGFVI